MKNLKEYKITETREIVRGFYDLIYVVEAENEEKAYKLIEEFPEEYLIDQVFDIRDSEALEADIRNWVKPMTYQELKRKVWQEDYSDYKSWEDFEENYHQ